jgi:hypothetical protein
MKWTLLALEKAGMVAEVEAPVTYLSFGASAG